MYVVINIIILFPRWFQQSDMCFAVVRNQQHELFMQPVKSPLISSKYL